MSGAEAERVVCQVSVREKMTESVDDVAYKVILKLDVRCPASSVIRVAPTHDGVGIAAVAVLSRLVDKKTSWTSLLSHNTVLLSQTAVPRCTTVTESSFRNIEVGMVFDTRVTSRLPSDSSVRFLFESICKDEQKGPSVTRFYSQPLGVTNVKP